jgi:hypothetical protein
LTASFSQSGSSPSRSATAAAARRTESVGAKTASRSRVARRPSKHSAIAAPPTRNSYPAQSAGGDEYAPGPEGRRGLLKCGRVHPAQWRHEPPLCGVPSRLARPGGQRPVVAPCEVLGKCRQRGIHLGGTRRWRFASEPLGRNRCTTSGKVVRVVIKKLDDGVAPDRLKRLPLKQKIICKQSGTNSIQADRSGHHRLPPLPLVAQDIGPDAAGPPARGQRDSSPGSPEDAAPESPVRQEQHPLAERQPGTRLVDAQAFGTGNQALTGAGTPAVAAMTDSGHARSSVTWQRLLQG